MTMEPIDWRALVDEAVRRRKAEGLSQRSLAALAGVSLPTVNIFEQGAINLRFERVVAILETLGLFVRPDDENSLQSFIHQARRRWRELASDLPDEHPAKQRFGFSEQAYAIAGMSKYPSPSNLLKILGEAPRKSGWPLFLVSTRPDWKPVILADTIECWLGRPEDKQIFADPATSDFWQIAKDGRTYLRRGYQEDGPDHQPGAIFDLTLPIWRTAELFLHAAWLAKTLGGSPSDGIEFFARYTGLAGRELLSWAKPLLRFNHDGRYRARSATADLGLTATIEQIDHDLPAMIENFLHPLYQRFDGFVIPPALIASQVEEVRQFSGY